MVVVVVDLYQAVGLLEFEILAVVVEAVAGVVEGIE
jgi:hypothetical protein